MKKALPAVLAFLLLTGCMSMKSQKETVTEPADSLENAFAKLCSGDYESLPEEALQTEQKRFLEYYLTKVNTGKYNEHYQMSDGEHSGNVELVVYEDWISYNLIGNGGYEMVTCDGVGRRAKSGNWYYEDITLPEDHTYHSQLQAITEKMEFADSVEFTAINSDYEERTYFCERYTDGDKLTCYICFNRAGEICCMTITDGVRYNDITDYSLSTEFGVYSAPYMEVLYDRFEQNYLPLFPKETHYENDIFDFSAERIRGENIDNPHIVEKYRSFFDTAEAFTISISAQRNDLMMWNYATKSGEDFYTMDALRKGKEDKIITEHITKDGQQFYRCYSEEKEEQYRLTNGDAGLYIYYLIQNNDRPEYGDVAAFVEAYNVTVNDEEYICEVWTLGSEKEYSAYCKDGVIVAIDVIFYDEHEETIIESLYDYAEPEYIITPEQYLPNYSEYQ